MAADDAKTDIRVSFSRINSQRRYEIVAEQVLKAIASGDLDPGERLPSDRALSEQMGVSRPTVREALLALQFLGVVEVKPGEGAYVVSESTRDDRDPTIRGVSMEPSEVLEARLVIEPAIARLAASRVDEAAVAALELNVNKSGALVRVEDPLSDMVQLTLDFHSILAPIAGNRFLASFSRSLVNVTEHPLWELLNRHALRTEQSRQKQVNEHRGILEAISNRDSITAETRMTEHLDGMRELMFGPRAITD